MCFEGTHQQQPTTHHRSNDQKVPLGLSQNTPASTMQWPSTKRHIMPRTHEWYLASTTYYTLNEHTIRSANLAHCTYKSSRTLPLFCEAYCTERMHFARLRPSGILRATDIWETANFYDKRTFHLFFTRKQQRRCTLDCVAFFGATGDM